MKDEVIWVVSFYWCSPHVNTSWCGKYFEYLAFYIRGVVSTTPRSFHFAFIYNTRGFCNRLTTIINVLLMQLFSLRMHRTWSQFRGTYISSWAVDFVAAIFLFEIIPLFNFPISFSLAPVHFFLIFFHNFFIGMLYDYDHYLLSWLSIQYLSWWCPNNPQLRLPTYALVK